jgi:hypothetical protein
MAKAKRGSTCAPLRLRLGRQSFCHSPLLEPREDKRSLPTTPADINHGEDFGLTFPSEGATAPPSGSTAAKLQRGPQDAGHLSILLLKAQDGLWP